VAEIRAMPLPVPAGGLPLGGLWELRSDEPRFRGLSGLAWDNGRLIAVTDSGAVVAWKPPGGSGAFRDLPGGPGPPQWKIHRDAEAITRDRGGRGWWVTFEQTHEAWLFDSAFESALGRRPVRLDTRWRNWGVEAAVSLPVGLLLLPEDGAEAILLRDGGEERTGLSLSGSISDAALLSDMQIVVSTRRIRPWGIDNRLAWLDGVERYWVRDWGRLPLGRWDNVEGLAVEPLPDGRARLWFVTDNDGDRRTLLGWVPLRIGPDSTGLGG
jgi:hypothetical protein